jgi:isopenicillin N synthase-like dioxygenase
MTMMMMAHLRMATFLTLFLLLQLSFMPDYVNSSSKEQDALLSTKTIPVIDIQAWTQPELYSDMDRIVIAKAIDQACRGIGFFAITNHGVEKHIIEHAWNAMEAFFDLPFEIKLQSKTDNDKEYPYGYENNEKLQLGKKKNHDNKSSTGASSDYDATPPDLKETFSIGPYNPASGQQPPRFPAQPVDLKSALSAYYRALEKLAMLLLHIFAVALDLPNPAMWFQNKMNHHISALRILNYPPIENILLPAKGQLRASAHTDYGVFTILKSGGPGLQVKKDVVEVEQGEGDDEGQHEQDWIDVPNLNDAFIINIGDLMQRWTNGACALFGLVFMFGHFE